MRKSMSTDVLKTHFWFVLVLVLNNVMHSSANRALVLVFLSRVEIVHLGIDKSDNVSNKMNQNTNHTNPWIFT